MSTPPHEPITGPLGAIEPNVVLAGLEGVVTAWLAASVLRGALIPLPLPNEWRWFYLVYAIAVVDGWRAAALDRSTTPVSGVAEPSPKDPVEAGRRRALQDDQHGGVRRPRRGADGDQPVRRSGE